MTDDSGYLDFTKSLHLISRKEKQQIDVRVELQTCSQEDETEDFEIQTPSSRTT